MIRHWHPWVFNPQEWASLSLSLGMVLLAALAGLAASWLLSFFLLRLARRTGTTFGSVLVKRLRSPVRFLLPLLAVMLVVPPLAFSDAAIVFMKHLFGLCIIAGITWLFINITLTGQDLVLSRFDVETRDNLKARSVHTQLTILVKVVLVVILVVSAASMLMTFDKIRHVGVSILASAGMIGIILGFAAQRSIATLFAGLQIALAQPIRIDDAVIVEGEWGWVEEITLTYVVIKIWDLRRLVVPVTYFLEKPFQNWTRESAKLLGTVFLYVDYSVPVDQVRQVLRDILQASDKWDGEVCGVQVTNCSERTLELRLLMSAADSSKAFDLRCEVREKVLAFLQREHPETLPRVRADVSGAAPQAAAGLGPGRG
jgi:small-conductance mechanosensitive channel